MFDLPDKKVVRSPLDMLEEWDRIMENPQDPRSKPPAELVSLRRHLIEEEFKETDHELKLHLSRVGGNRENLAKELADLVYVVYGTATALKIDLDEALEQVHQSNLSKLDENGKPLRRQDGKVLKGPNYRPPDMSIAANTPIDGTAVEIKEDDHATN